MNKQKYNSQISAIQNDKKRLWLVIMSLVIALLMSLALNFSKKDDVTVEVVPQFLNKSVSIAGGVFNDAYYEQMTRYWLGLLFNFQPNTVKYQFNEFLRFVNPRDYAAVRKKLSIQAKRIIFNGSSSTFYPMDIKINKSNILVHGELIGMIGDKVVKRKQTTFSFDVTTQNGLRVKSINEVVVEGKKVRVVKAEVNDNFLDKNNVVLEPTYTE